MGAVRFHLITLGCPKNEADSDLIASRLQEEGYLEVGDWEEADIIVVNTCSFIREAVEESLETIMDLGSVKSEGKMLLVTGCLYQRYGEGLRELLPEVDGFFLPDEMPDLNGVADVPTPTERKACGPSRDSRRRRFSGLSQGHAYIKIAEGCDRGCSFCTIPRIKGRLKSREPEDLLGEAKEAIGRGARELVLLSQDTASYGRDLGMRSGLVGLLESMASLEGDFRIRVMYLQPDAVDGPLIDMLGHPKVCSYLDVPFQHVSAPVLRAMGRKGSEGRFRRLVEEARDRVPGLAIRSSFITGFPEEDRRSFRQMLEFVEEVRLDWLSVFPFSPEEGTRAAGLRAGCTRSTAERRARELREVQEEIMREKAESMKGSIVRALVEGPSDMAPGHLQARSHREAPEVDGLIFIRSDAPIRCPEFHDVLITGSDGIDLLASPMEAALRASRFSTRWPRSRLQVLGESDLNPAESAVGEDGHRKT